MKTAKRLAQRKIGEELFIVDTRHQMVHIPNQVGELIWGLIRKGHEPKSIVSQIIQEFDVDPRQAENDLSSFIVELQEKKMIETGE